MKVPYDVFLARGSASDINSWSAPEHGAELSAGVRTSGAEGSLAHRRQRRGTSHLPALSVVRKFVSESMTPINGLYICVALMHRTSLPPSRGTDCMCGA